MTYYNEIYKVLNHLPNAVAYTIENFIEFENRLGINHNISANLIQILSKLDVAILTNIGGYKKISDEITTLTIRINSTPFRLDTLGNIFYTRHYEYHNTTYLVSVDDVIGILYGYKEFEQLSEWISYEDDSLYRFHPAEPTFPVIPLFGDDIGFDSNLEQEDAKSVDSTKNPNSADDVILLMTINLTQLISLLYSSDAYREGDVELDQLAELLQRNLTIISNWYED